MRNSIYTVLAIILISVGIVVFILPIPMGALMIAAGLGMLMRYSEGFAAFVKRIRYKYPSFNEFLAKVEARLPDGLRVTLEVSNPDKYPDPSLIAETADDHPWYEPIITCIAYVITQSSNFFIYLSKLFKKSPSESTEKSVSLVKRLTSYLAPLWKIWHYLISWISWPPRVSNDDLESQISADLPVNGSQQNDATSPQSQEGVKQPPLMNEPPSLSDTEKNLATPAVQRLSHPTASNSLSNNGDMHS